MEQAGCPPPPSRPPALREPPEHHPRDPGAAPRDPRLQGCGMPAGGLTALPPEVPRRRPALGVSGYFLKRTQDRRQESWFLNNFLRAPPLPSHSDFSSHRLTAGASGGLRLSVYPAVLPLLWHCLPSAPSPQACFSPPPPPICRPLPGHCGRRALRAGQVRGWGEGSPTQGAVLPSRIPRLAGVAGQEEGSARRQQ